MDHFLSLIVVLLSGVLVFIAVGAQSTTTFNLQFVSFLRKYYSDFHEIAQNSKKNKKGTQFAVLVLFTPQQLKNLDNVKLTPYNSNKKLQLDANEILDQNENRNYLFATPQRKRKGKHSESLILHHLNAFVQNFKHFNKEIGGAMLYTYLDPCSDCINQIIDNFKDHEFPVTLIHSAYWFLPRANRRDTRRVPIEVREIQDRIRDTNIHLYRIKWQCLVTEEVLESESKDQCISIQEFLVYEIYRFKSMYPWCMTNYESLKQRINFVNTIMAECSSELSNLEECSKRVVLKLLEKDLHRDRVALFISGRIGKLLTYHIKFFLSEPLTIQDFTLKPEKVRLTMRAPWYPFDQFDDGDRCFYYYQNRQDPNTCLPHHFMENMVPKSPGSKK